MLAEDLGGLAQPPVARGSVLAVFITVWSGLGHATGITVSAGGLAASSSSSSEMFLRWKDSPLSAVGLKPLSLNLTGSWQCLGGFWSINTFAAAAMGATAGVAVRGVAATGVAVMGAGVALGATRWRIFNSAEGAADIYVEGRKIVCDMFVP
jgi:hypothetical protein